MNFITFKDGVGNERKAKIEHFGMKYIAFSKGPNGVTGIGV